jgi:protein SCO1/2
MDPQGKFVRGLDFDTPSDRIADTLRALHGAANEGNAALD